MADSSGTAEPLGPEELLAHRRFLRLLAGGLVRDEHRAEDLVQDTWVKALESPPQEAARGGGASLRAWLGRVLRNRAINEGQREAQRGERERYGRSQAQEPAWEQVGAELETQRQVVESLQALREPYRSTLYLRYYRELGPSKIAELQGIPIKTVKTRLTRGLEEMRQVLDRQSGGKREDWALLLLPLIRGKDLPLAPIGAGLGASQAGGITLGLKLALGLAALAFAVVGLRDTFTAGPHVSDHAALNLAAPLDQDPDATGAMLPLQQDSGARLVRQRISSSQAPALETTAPGGLIRGRVINYSGEPVALAELKLVPLRLNPGFKAQILSSVTADVEGRFSLEAPWLGVLGLVVIAEGHATSQRLILGLGQPQDLGDLRLDRGVQLSGRVLDSLGLPVVGARVGASVDLSRPVPTASGLMQHGLTDEQGLFVLPGQPIGPWNLSITASGFLPQQSVGMDESFVVQDGQSWVGEIELEPGVKLRGRVESLPQEWSSPEKMARLRVRIHVLPQQKEPHGLGEFDHGQSLQTDASFAFDGLAKGAEYAVLLFAGDASRGQLLGKARGVGGGPPVELIWDGASSGVAPGATAAVDQGLQNEGAQLEALVSSSDGRAQAGVLLSRRAIGRGSDSFDEFRVTNESGRAIWNNLGAGEHLVSIVRAEPSIDWGYGRSGGGPGKRVNLLVGERKIMELRALDSTRLIGRVMQDGSPLPGAMLTLHFEQKIAAPRAQRTDSEGRFAWNGLEPGSYRITVRHASRYLETSFDVVVGQEDQEKTLELTSASLRGRVVDDHARGLAGVRIEPLPESGVRQRPAFVPRLGPESLISDAQGYFALTGLDPGRKFILEASGLGFGRSRSPWIELGPGEQREGLQLILSKAADLLVRLRGELADEGKPNPRRCAYFLRARNTEDAPGTMEWQSEPSRGRKQRLDDLPPGTYWVQLYSRDRRQTTALGERRRVVLKQGKVTAVDLDL